MSVVSPLSSQENVTHLKTISASEVISAWKERYEIDIKSELSDCTEISLYKCNNSELNFFKPSNIAGSDKLYKILGDLDWYYIPDKWEHKIALKDLRDHKRILEVGCGSGYFLEQLSQNNTDVSGIELNEQAVSIAKSKGLFVSRINLNELVLNELESFDAVCSFQVLEHIAEPKEFLVSLVDLVKKGGKIILSVPNSKCFSQYSTDNLLDQPPHHMTQWCRESFEYLNSILPIYVKHIYYEPLAEYHVDWYIRTQLSRIPNVWLLKSLSFRFSYGVLSPLLKKCSLLRRMIKGHTLYVCLVKE